MTRDPKVWRKRRIRRAIICQPWMPLRISWALRRFVLTSEQDAILAAEMREMLNGIIGRNEA